MFLINIFQGLFMILVLSYITAKDIGHTCCSCTSRPIDCQDVQGPGPSLPSGVYMIFPRGNDNGVSVRCDMATDGGRWTVIQRRVNNKTNFYNGWDDYETGFGDFSSNFWLGNTHIHDISTQGLYELRIDMTGPMGDIRYAKYDLFAIGNSDSKYILHIGIYSGDAGDSLQSHNGMKFTTKDQDNDTAAKNCAIEYIGAWWYTSCHSSNLNGEYGNNKHGKGINWLTFTTHLKSLKEVEMKIRRKI